MQLAAGAGIAQACAEGAEELLVQGRGLGLGALPPDQRGDHEHIAGHVRAIGRRRAEAGQQQAAGRRAQGACDVDAQRVQRHRVLEVAARHQLGHDGLPGRPHQRRAYAAHEGQRHQVLHGQRVGACQQQQAGADGGQQDLDADQEASAVQDVGQHTGRNRQQEDGQRGRRLDQGHGGRAGRQLGHHPGAGHIAHEAADIAQHRGGPQHREHGLAQRREAAGGSGCGCARISGHGALPGHARRRTGSRRPGPDARRRNWPP